MLKKIVDGQPYLDESGEPFKVVGQARLMNSGGGKMIVFQNLSSTILNPVKFTPLVMSEVLFLKSFKEVPSND